MNNNIRVSIKGRNINNYLKWLFKQNINIINLKVINYKEVNIIIDYKDYNLLNKYSKTYEINVIEKYGKLKIKTIIKNNYFILISIFISLTCIYFLSNIIFSVEIIYNNNDLVNKLEKELANYGIRKYGIKKERNYIEKVKKQILENNKDTIEWLEIEEFGTKYTIKLVERKQETKESGYDYQSIIASKDAIITNIKAYQGEKNKDIGEYINKDEVAISGILEKGDGEKLYTKAKGTIYGEVWYKVTIEYPYIYYEEKITGKHKDVLNFYFLNHKISLFPYKKYKQFKTNSHDIVVDLLDIFKITKEKEYEVLIKEEIYTQEEVIIKSQELAKEKLLNSNDKITKIKDIKIINKIDEDSKINISFFISAEEDITKVVEVKKETFE